MTARRARALLPLALVAACGSGEPEPSSPKDGGRAAETAVAPTDYDARALPPLFRDRLPPVTDAVAAQMALRDPSANYWPSEVAAERAEAVLTDVLFGLFVGEARVAESFEGATALRPGDLRQVFDDGATTVWRAGAFEQDLRGRGELEAVGARLAAAFGTREPAVDVLVTRIQLGQRTAETTALVELAVRATPPVRVGLTLEAAWSGEAGELELRRLVLTDYEEVRATAPLFADVTMSVFGGADFASELLRGVDDYYMRIDRRAGTAFQGMQGLAVGDVNGDGLEDVLVCQQVGLPNRLFVQEPDGRAVDRAAEAKLNYLEVTRAALFVDLDGDGDQDVLLALGPRLVVAYNDGAGVFDDPHVFDTEGKEQIYSLSAADADGDGDLDVFAGRYALEGVMHGVPSPYHDAANGASNYYWRNDGVGRFTDATEESGLAAVNTRFTLASIWDDFDEDGDLDLYVVNDFGSNNLFRNDGSGHFVDVAADSGSRDVGAGMGATVADYDLDGDQDLYVTNMFSAPGLRIASQHDRFMDGRHTEVHRWYEKHARGNSLLRNRGDGTFEDVTDEARVAIGRWGWGALFVDFNNDGLEDLYVPCGHATHRRGKGELEAYFWHRVISSSPPDASSKEQYANAFGAVHRMVMYDEVSWNGRERNCAYLNLGATRFAGVSAVTGADVPDDSRAAARLDWDDDGRLDLLLKSRNAPRLRLMHNRAETGNGWIALELIGVGANRDAIGARVSVELEGRTLTRRLHAGSGYLAQSSKRLHFGLGDAHRARSVSVDWPDGTRDTFADLAAGHRWRLTEGTADAERAPARSPVRATAKAAPAEWNPAPVDRVVLAERLPMAAFAAPSFQKPDGRVGDYAGRPALVLLFTAADPGGEAALSRLAARQGELRSARLRLAPLSVDDGPGLAAARRLAERYDLGQHAGFADGRVRETYEMAMLELLGYFREVPAPTGFLLDPAGNLAVVYLGPPEVDTVLRDLEILAAIKSPLGTARLSGGRWLERPRRDYRELAEAFGARGHGAIGAYYAELADRSGR